ncbi:uncharacterized protein F54H12.2-like [Macrosteles quadrilineatus]|uniref:uncharacterized protein F54H12.2-like n=1 Tax=Macrosteles quadrilineatus TaxID=74068 RepID=UPI0023E13410|nr:uncharacterized protein F54H12.2-like [Macrosteles quadrilineatus]
MAFLHHQSCECVKSELDLFTLPATQTSIENGKWVQYKPISSLTDDSPIEFVVPGHGDEYSDLSNTMLNIKACIVKPDGTKLDPLVDTSVGPANNWLHSMFSQVDLYVNQKMVSPQNNTYAYRSYIETLLNYDESAKDSHLSCALWYDDKSGEMDDCESKNTGLENRRYFTKSSNVVDMVGHLHVDLFNQEKFLLNGVELRLRLVRSRDSFCLMSKTEKYKVKIVEANLLIRKNKINPTVLLAHSKTLESGTAKYPITRVEVKAMTIPSGIQGKTLDNVFLGQLPKRIIVGLVSNKAFNGDFKSNPFNFQSYKVNFFSLYVDGVQIPSKPLQPEYSENKELSVMAYHTLFSGTGIHFLNMGNSITRSDYSQGNCLMAFDLTPDLSANATTHWNLIRHGSLRIELGFSEALTETINCIVYAEFDNIIEIDKNRNVTVDYGS